MKEREKDSSKGSPICCLVPNHLYGWELGAPVGHLAADRSLCTQMALHIGWRHTCSVPGLVAPGLEIVQLS